MKSQLDAGPVFAERTHKYRPILSVIYLLYSLPQIKIYRLVLYFTIQPAKTGILS